MLMSLNVKQDYWRRIHLDNFMIRENQLSHQEQLSLTNHKTV